MTKNDPVLTIINQNLVEELVSAYSVNSQYKDDLIQEIYLILLEYDKDKLQKLINDKQIKFFIARIIRNQWFSKTSTFFKQFKKYNSLKDSNTVDDDKPEETDD